MFCYLRINEVLNWVFFPSYLLSFNTPSCDYHESRYDFWLSIWSIPEEICQKPIFSFSEGKRDKKNHFVGLSETIELEGVYLQLSDSTGGLFTINPFN